MGDHFTLEEAIHAISQTPDGRALVRACYIDEDVVAACGRFYVSEEWKALRRLIKGFGVTGTALDLGAGNGIASYGLDKDGFKVFSLEPDPSELVGRGAIDVMVNICNLPIVCVNGFGENMDVSSDSIDVVYARQVLHHASNLEKMLAEIQRVLKPGGYLIACREHVVDSDIDLRVFLDRHPVHHLTGNEYAYSKEEYANAISNAGLDLELLLGSWDTVINHYPVSLKQMYKMMMREFVDRYYGFGLVSIFSAKSRKSWRLSQSERDRTPGRMMSFIAKKKPCG